MSAKKRHQGIPEIKIEDSSQPIIYKGQFDEVQDDAQEEKQGEKSPPLNSDDLGLPNFGQDRHGNYSSPVFKKMGSSSIKQNLVDHLQVNSNQS